jgi:LacI family transcriptional regulator, galactose operon repressor
MSEFKASTIRDVALAAGVSPTSVSRHLNGQISLPQGTAARIDAAVLQLGYRPNAIARRLTLGATETLGFVTTDIAYPFFAAIASSAELEAARLGYSMSIFNSRNDLKKELQFLGRIHEHQVDGILFMTNHVDDGQLARKINQSRHVVLLDEDVADASAPRVFADNVAGGRLAAGHLIKQGHRRIGFVSGPRGMVSVEERFRGFINVMRGAGFSIDNDLLLFGTYQEEFGVSAFRRLWECRPRPTAIFATADMLAIGIMRAARDSGVEIPRSLSVIGFDDMLHVSLLNPPLTTIRQSAVEFGCQGVRLLVDHIKGRPIPSRRTRVRVELIVRGSVARPAVERPRSFRSRLGSSAPAGDGRPPPAPGATRASARGGDR